MPLAVPYPQFNFTARKLRSVDFDKLLVHYVVGHTTSSFAYDGGAPLMPGDAFLTVSLQAGCVISAEWLRDGRKKRVLIFETVPDDTTQRVALLRPIVLCRWRRV